MARRERVGATHGEFTLTALADKDFEQVSRSEGLPIEDQARADFYRLLASLLSAPPSQDVIRAVGTLTGDDTALGQRITTLARIAARANADSVSIEYHELFIGLGRGELVPYGSYYLTGFLQEKPLAQLRRDMATLGVGRSDTTRDPEDHAASVTEIMAGLVDGRFDAPVSLYAQKDFYTRHLASWLPIFFRDLEVAKASVFYSAVGSVGRAFLDVEDGAFTMV